MAEFCPNKEQKEAIEASGSHILVSAAAGSGKTTVLVERVLRMIIDERVDIDSLVIMTFTKAAAAHMREKIFSRIRSTLAKDGLPDETKEHLRAQQMKVFHARIGTIDSLCGMIVREHFQDVDIDPGFRIADENELSLLEQDVLQELIEEHYANPDENFLQFSAYYTDKNDVKLDEIILTLYRFSQSHPEPKRWLKNAAAPYTRIGALMEGCDAEDEGEVQWLLVFRERILSQFQALAERAQRGLALCEENGGPEAYASNFTYVLDNLARLNGVPCDTIKEILKETIEKWPRLKSIGKNDSVISELQEAAKQLNTDLKIDIKSLLEHYFYQNLESMYLDMQDCAPVAETILNLTLEFTERFAAAKKARQIAGFSDVEHFALDVLVQRDDDGRILRDASGHMLCTPAADAIANATKEIIVDEYQDTNRLQEALIEAMSSERFGRPNVFMVGDVKQSIYGFRQACPDLFLEKYNRYVQPGSAGKRIVLGDNYRSRKEVVNFINLVFDQIMKPELGGIDYQDGNRMTAGASFADVARENDIIPEFLVINANAAEGRKTEAYKIARKIEEIVENGYVCDADAKGGLRKACYSDIAILTRKTDNPQIETVLAQRHIPIRKSDGKGFFSTMEVRLALNLLRICDNPYQDIPLAAVLLSPVADLTATDLARIKSSYEVQPFSLMEACRFYAENHTDECAVKLQALLENLEIWRNAAQIMGVREFLDYLLDTSSLAELCSAMVQGGARNANLNFLKGLAESFAKTSYSGLFHFLRYLDQIEKSDKDFAQAQDAEAAFDAVSLMTIHKSKGLEFPIVILADAGKAFTNKDASEAVLLDETLGMGIEKRDLDTRIKKRTLLIQLIQDEKKRSLCAEEIRLLYVALTRAQEKLIITGFCNLNDKKKAEWEGASVSFAPDLFDLLSDPSYVSLLADALKCADEKERKGFIWTIQDPVETELERAYEIFDEQKQRESVQKIIEETPAGGDTGIYRFAYPWPDAVTQKAKITASEMETHERVVIEEEEEKVYHPRPKTKTGLSGAERGSAYHKLFEKLDYDAVLDCEQEAAKIGEEPTKDTLCELVLQNINRLLTSGHLNKEQADAIAPQKIAAFLQSSIGKRMAKAYQAGTLHREQQFVMETDETGVPGVLVQGIIDAYFIEETEKGKGIILVDYKTDRYANEEELKERYGRQQDMYAEACEAALGLPVLEKILYAVESEREIFLL